jgi:hypothetical protein
LGGPATWLPLFHVTCEPSESHAVLLGPLAEEPISLRNGQRMPPGFRISHDARDGEGFPFKQLAQLPTRDPDRLMTWRSPSQGPAPPFKSEFQEMALVPHAGDCSD